MNVVQIDVTTPENMDILYEEWHLCLTGFCSCGKRINALSSTNGIVATEMHCGAIIGDKFYDFVRGTLIQNMLPFNWPPQFCSCHG